MSREDRRNRKTDIDEQIFKRIAAGDDAAFEELYYASYRQLYAFILSMTMNKEDAEDVLQDTYIKIKSSCHMYQDQGNPMAWMMKISKNIYLMKLRSEKRYEVVNISDFENSLSLEQISNADDRLMLEKLFEQVSGEERNIIIMHVIMGMKFREVAEILELPLGTVLAKYNRSMKALRKSIEAKSGKGA